MTFQSNAPGSGGGGSSGVSSFNTRTGAVVATTGDYTAAEVTGAVRKSAGNIGDGSTNPITYTHSLGTTDITVAVFETASPLEMVMPTIAIVDTNDITLSFSVAPTSGQYRVVVTG